MRSELVNALPRAGVSQIVVRLAADNRTEVWCQAPASWIGSTLTLFATSSGVRRRVARGVLRSSSASRRVMSFEGAAEWVELEVTSAAGASGSCAMLVTADDGSHTEATRPAPSGETVTPADGGEHWYASLFIGTGGNVTVDHQGAGTNVLYANVPSGTVLPVSVSRVYATGTTAGNIVGQDE